MIIAAIAYMLIRIYDTSKADETVVHEWIDFPEIAKLQQTKTAKEDKQTTLHVRLFLSGRLNEEDILVACRLAERSCLASTTPIEMMTTFGTRSFCAWIIII